MLHQLIKNFNFAEILILILLNRNSPNNKRILMVRIGLLSDTHMWWDDKYEYYFKDCDEIWHAGDIGSVEVADRLAAIKPLRAVYGNIDGQQIRRMFPKDQRFTIEGADVWLTHIGGYPGKYAREVTKPKRYFEWCTYKCRK